MSNDYPGSCSQGELQGSVEQAWNWVQDKKEQSEVESYITNVLLVFLWIFCLQALQWVTEWPITQIVE